MKILTCIIHTVVNVSCIENVCLYNFIVVMCNTEFIQIEAGLLKVNAGVQHSKCLKYVKCSLAEGAHINVWSIIVMGNNHRKKMEFGPACI